ncbi:hypothetical protein CULC0102_0109 [Corynebacterium ulcerans 0102]|nr:hypothetical protein CULC0102_0109 [Corynebacterium ulcerans 0102]
MAKLLMVRSVALMDDSSLSLELVRSLFALQCGR